MITNTSTKNKDTKVYVGVSGGVDSSVSLSLLKEAGYNVTGVFIKVWHPPFFECDWKKERHDAMRVCAHLDIPFKTLDLEKEYKNRVVDYMLKEYKQGRTPNPDVMCNSHIKFGAFLDWAINEEDADYVATGHYARRQKQDDGSVVLLSGKDNQKDQTYFLWRLSQTELKHTLFPVGEYEKSEVRKIAKEKGLFTATKKDSQGLCFVGDVDMKDFLGRFIDLREGDVLNKEGDIIGSHDGAYVYTIGQRRGFEVTKKKPDDGPWYVIEKDVDSNTITVGQNKDDTLNNGKKITLSDVNWISGKIPDGDVRYRARIRYNQPLQSCKVERDGDTWSVIFDTPQYAAACGQSVVVYHKDQCIGGGVIDSVQKSADKGHLAYAHSRQ